MEANLRGMIELGKLDHSSLGSPVEAAATTVTETLFRAFFDQE